MAAKEAVAERPTHLRSTGEVDWDALYADHLPRIYNYFRFRLAAQADVEDLTARTFEKAWSARDRYRRDLAGFATWLYRIAHNLCIDHLRSRREHAPLDAASVIAAERTPEIDAERRSDLTRLAALTASLSDRERELIALKYGAGLSNRAIAPLVNLSESNVGTILHRTVQALRSQW
ncbi:MAG TPA: sigma-70 family RNA polymerase sigma factor [Steroidobacteraceae bacterium]|jgi:RNA polymerase sigma factor, sigma-70 family|nr:sigma-70 family RNA polymerase sigma factor [Steroidobacteraceae bacterium]